MRAPCVPGPLPGLLLALGLSAHSAGTAGAASAAAAPPTPPRPPTAAGAALGADDPPPQQMELRRPRWRLAAQRSLQPQLAGQRPEVTAGGSASPGSRRGPSLVAEAVARWEAAAATAAAASATAVVAANAAGGHAGARGAGDAAAAVVRPPGAGGQYEGTSPLSADLAEEDARLRVENERLREESGRLEGERAALRSEVLALRRAEAALRADDTALRSEDTRLRGTLAALASSVALARRGAADQGGGGGVSLLGQGAGTRARLSHTAIVVICVMSGAIAVLSCLFFSCLMSGDDDTDSADEDEEFAENQLKELLDDKGQRECPLCWCCYHPMLMAFLVGVTVITLLGGAVLWELGVLQPILSQCIMYIYIMVVVVAFVSLMLSMLWRLVRRLINYIITEFQKLKSVWRFFSHKSKHKWRDLLDDGRLNDSYEPPRERMRRLSTKPNRDERDEEGGRCVQS